MKKIAVYIALVFAISTVNAQIWNCDPVHSNVMFTVDHLVISEVQGSFKVFDGRMTAKKADLSDASIDFRIDVSSINTDNAYRDKHLRSDDFFNAEKFPAVTFKSTEMKKVGDNKYALTGVLTIRDVARLVTFDLKYGGDAVNGMGKKVKGFKAETTINRFDFNLQWNAATELGGAIVGKDVTIRCNIEMIQGEKM